MTDKNSWYLMLAVAVMLTSLLSLSSCKKDKDDDDTFTYSSSRQTTLVRTFNLQTDSEVLASLDSVYFTIDYDRGLIYNADSLPVGTDITGLKVTMQFMNTVSSAVFSISGATHQADTTIEYTSSMTQSLDFTGRTQLKVTSADMSQEKVYEVKVLVHKVNPDSLAWPQSQRRDLPGMDNAATAYKVVKTDDGYCALSTDGTTVDLLTASHPGQGTWSRTRLSLPFEPQVASLTSTGLALYMLATDGELYTSVDGMSWTSCGVQWHSVLGAYDDRVLGIIAGSDGYYHDEYPRGGTFASTRVEDGFPVHGASDMIIADNSWAMSPQAMIAGGIDAAGKTLNTVWGYDGTTWGRISSSTGNTLPALSGATLFAYYTYRSASGVRRYARQSTWYLMGGRLANGSLNRNIYLSSNQGIKWTAGDSTMCQASYMPAFYGAQAIVDTETCTAAAGSLAPRRAAALVTSWECPYIYLFGGYDAQGRLLPNVWRGVYIRLSNYPLQ